METKTETLTANDFFEKLQYDKFEQSMPFSIVGMVKKSEGKEKVIEFAPNNCSHWVTIPLEFIEEVEVLKTVPCKDHSHPLVKLSMKTPKTSEGKIFYSMLESMKQGREGMQSQNDQPDRYNPNSYNEPMPFSSTRPGGFGNFGGFGGGLNLNGSCRVLEYQCTCTKWEKVNFGVWRCIAEDCKFVCTVYN